MSSVEITHGILRQEGAFEVHFQVVDQWPDTTKTIYTIMEAHPHAGFRPIASVIATATYEEGTGYRTFIKTELTRPEISMTPEAVRVLGETLIEASGDLADVRAEGADD